MDLKGFFITFPMLLLLSVLYMFPCQESVSTSAPIPTTIWWTDDLFPYLEDTVTITCGESKCISTKKKDFTNRTGDVAFIFYGTDFDPENLPLPRNPCHIWALLHEESPLNNFMFSHTAGIKLFNYTSTFSRYSDYPLTTQFIQNVNYITDRKPMPTSEKNKLRLIGLAPIVYVQSHCNIASDRDRYVEELMKYIDVDSYGTCLHNKDLPPNLNTQEAYDDLEFYNFVAQYKFTLAFENAICDDYITEKLLRPLHVGSVPIYKGSASVMDWTPSPHSIILIDDFANPKDLAAYISWLDRNDESYESYLTFKTGIKNENLVKEISKRDYGVNEEDKIDFIKGYECYVCKQMNKNPCSVHDNKAFPSKTANRKHMNCQQPHPSLDVGILSPKDKWMKETWVETYWFALDQAKAVQNMIQNNETDSHKFSNYIMKLKYKN